MKKIKENIVLKGMAGTYSVLHDGKIVSAKARGKLKAEGKLVAGDRVKLSEDDYAKGEYVIDGLKERKNVINRPRVANIDQLVIVLGVEPKPDFYLIDKLLINCVKKDIEPLLVINKEDLCTTEFIEDIVSQYDGVTDIISCSGKTGKGVEELKNRLRGKVSVFAGQSAVGKSTILNSISKELKLATGGLSEKSGRGRHTTRVCQIYLIEDMMIADTPGFSMLDLEEIEPKDLSGYFIDFDEYRSKCRYTDCSHVNTTAKECSVKKAVEEGKLSEKRYNRYLDLYKEMKKAWDNKY